jgi:hypothetical protein
VLEAGIGDVQHDDPAGREQPRGHHRRQADRAGTDDRDRVTRADAAVQDAHLVRGRKDVREEQRLLVRDLRRQLVH